MTDWLFGTPLYFHGVNLIADPVHRYIPITYPVDGYSGKETATERDILDSPWVQRLRRIHQLQNAMWVFPGAEHSRFVHSLGVMHCAAYFARSLYSSLKDSLEQVGADCPSLPCVEETARIAGLTHDLGHGPLCHFFDEQYLAQYGITHEDLSQKIISEYLGNVIGQLRRSPTGWLADDERIDPRNVAFLIKKPLENDKSAYEPPLWVKWLQPLFCGIFTVDNIDYALRDAYMCGISTRLIDMERLSFYTFFTEHGLTFHQTGLSALEMFLKSRWYLYNNVYYHRTVRGIDLQLSEFFTETIRLILKGDPRDCMDAYLKLTDMTLYDTVSKWSQDADPERQRLGRAWEDVLQRKINWKRVYEKELLPQKGSAPDASQASEEKENKTPGELEAEIRANLPTELRHINFKLDMTTHDTRPLNPIIFKSEKLLVYNPSLKETRERFVDELFPYMPEIAALLRIYTEHGEYAEELTAAAEKLSPAMPSSGGLTTNL